MMTIDQANDILVNGDGLLAISLEKGSFPNDAPYIMFKRLSKVAVVVILRSGWAEVEVDHVVRHATEGNVFLLGNFNIIGHVSQSKDMSAYVLIISKKFLSRIVPETSVAGRPYFAAPITNIMAMRDNPVIYLDEKEKEEIQKFFCRVKYNVERRDAPLRLQLLYVSAIEFLMELMNIAIPKFSLDSPKKTKLDRSQYIVEEFSRLVFAYFKKEHSVSFYAGKLCISSQYLSKATKKVLGVSAIKVIEDMLHTESIIMLRNPKISIQQISSELGFSDQSSFGKFFKKTSGMSPLSYRKQL